MPPEAPLLLERLQPVSAMWTGRVNGQIVAFTGITQIHPHLAEVWSYLHEDAKRHRFWLHRETVKYLRETVAANPYWRVQALVYTGHEAADRWIRRLGFEWESDMPFFGPGGESMTRYVWYPRGING